MHHFGYHFRFDYFIFKEGIEFFGQYRHELERYRKSGMEYATVVTKQHDDLTFYIVIWRIFFLKKVKHMKT